ncbi:MAG: VPLPA-CTERM sorting domain-containing protein [Albidovulum sp.]
MMKFSKMAGAAALAVLLAAMPAAATTVNVTAQGTNVFRDMNGQNAWFQSVSYTVNGTARHVSAGAFRFVGTTPNGNSQNFVAFCLEPLEWLSLRTYTDGTSLSASVVGQLGSLLSNAFGMVNNSTSAAAFQIAAWEIVSESVGNYNLGSGAFQLTSVNATTRTLAQGWLDSISSGQWTSTGGVRILTASGTQDLLTDMAPVPVPAAGMMLLGGLAGLVGLRRRRKARMA